MHRTPGAEAEVSRLMRESRDYFASVHGREPREADVDDFFDTPVPGIPKDDVRCYGIHAEGEAVGYAGLVLGWKRPGQSMIGILAIAGRHRGRGLGRAAVAELERIARQSPHGESLRIGIVETNVPAFGFWHALGFRETGERRTLPEYLGDIILLEKALDAP